MNKPIFHIAFLAALVVANVYAADISPETEKEQLAILRSDAPPGDKAIACKKLAIDGSAAAVPDLAKLLPNAQLSSWARIALETIPGPEADAALRKAAETLDGRLLVGTLNSIGVRRDAAAVELLSGRLTHQDAEVASAAAVALGRVGNEAATKVLRESLAKAPAQVRSAVAEGCVLCAERLLTAGKSTEAAEIYDEVRKAEVPKQRILEATRGAILARKEAGIPLLLEQLQSPDRGLFYIALSTARELPGNAIDKALAEELAKVKPERAAALIATMADRPQTVVLSAVLKAAGSGPKAARIAATNALGRIGDDSCLATLLDNALDADAELASAAKATIADLPGKKVDAEIVSQLGKAEGKKFTMLIGLVGQRRLDAVPTLVKALDSSDPGARRAALTALGETVDLSRLSVLITRVTSAKFADDAVIAQAALKSASVRMPDRDACAEELTKAFNQAPVSAKSTLLEILAEVGGTKALKTIGTAAKSSDVQMQDDASRLLGKWNGVEAAPVLLDLAKTGAPQFRTRALRGYIGLARKFTKSIPDAEHAAMCQNALDVAKQSAEQKLVVEVLKLHPSKESLKLAIKLLGTPELKDDATAATLLIAQKVSAQGVDVTDTLAKAGLEKVKVEIIKAEYGSGSTQKDVTLLVRKQVSDLPVISLPGATYNTSFGGDPAPGTVKQLKIQYKLNGKAGEATFAEDALIVLPMPK